ncbi:hypothetical protein CRYUN_Cryun32bG0015000 [Craigia yunnanensis]
MSYNHGIKILGSCNGLLCIRNIIEDMAIWNPSTRKHHVLPSLGSCNGYVYGFGHDPITDDYKVVKIMQHGSENYREVPQPEYKDKRFQLNVGVLGGCLCTIANYGDVRVDLWVMKEYGVKESWTRLFSVASDEEWWFSEKKVVYVWVPGMPLFRETEICLQSLISLNVNRRHHNGEDNKDIKKMDNFLSEGFKLV